MATTKAGRSEGAAAAVTFRLNRLALEKVIHSADGTVARDLAKAAVQVERRAKQLCPVDTGRLRSSITWAMEGQGTRDLSAVIGTNVSYARHVEFGTRFQGPRSFLRAALASVRSVSQIRGRR